ncbi:XRE family transcriptional regulator [Rhizobiaceae bacterium BDR2-2]|uniref:XRE family transcriptional regulator n=1 Tax=Ectorhizobium quercum TaxID=2965071 RepID=A0AAE3MXZ0_9HYPH|nr:XRE family transcriptional regulator [Ectorhizobium quercum]MCX8997078.1 XRE family transcriptional regulator [Ectorhizobium quercum]
MAVDDAPLPDESEFDPIEAIGVRTGRNLRRLRTRRGYSLDRLAKLSGVSRAMLGQIETGKSSPTLSILSKISAALEVPCGSLIVEAEEDGTAVLTRASAKILYGSDGKFQTRALFPFESDRTVEFYEVRIAPHHTEKAEAHRHGTVENIVVAVGTIEIIVGKQAPYILGEGDAIVFEANVPHVYRNMTSGDALFYLVSTFREAVHI